ncbi:hypothetical protein THIOSC15_1950002 [uncultured Thiomicrorhabdus sp.]
MEIQRTQMLNYLLMARSIMLNKCSEMLSAMKGLEDDPFGLGDKALLY